MILSSCTSGYGYKFISTSYTNLCLAEEKKECIKAINERCKSDYTIDSMQKYEYYIDSDKIIIKFNCRNRNG